MMLARACYILIGLMPLVGLRSAWSDPSVPATLPEAKAHPVTIGISIQNRDAQFYRDMESGMLKEAARYDYTLDIRNADRDVETQANQVNYFVSKRVSVILLTPYDSNAIGDSIVAANLRHIPVFTVDVADTSKRGRVVAHISGANDSGGLEAGKLMCAAIGRSGKVAIINESGVSSVASRIRGFEAALSQDCPKATVVDIVDSGGKRDEADEETALILAAHGDLNGIFGINDDSALGALAAVRKKGLVGKVEIIGYDGSDEAKKAILRGDMYADIVQDANGIGTRAIDVIHAYLEHEPLPPLTIDNKVFP